VETLRQSLRYDLESHSKIAVMVFDKLQFVAGLGKRSLAGNERAPKLRSPGKKPFAEASTN
jgi:hypothetical protein